MERGSSIHGYRLPKRVCAKLVQTGQSQRFHGNSWHCFHSGFSRAIQHSFRRAERREFFERPKREVVERYRRRLTNAGIEVDLGHIEALHDLGYLPIEIWTLPESERKSEEARKKAIAEADLSVLCLPDEAAIEAAGWAKQNGGRIIDASSAHRVAEGWVFGLPELTKDHRDAIANAQFVSNPGCYPSIFIPLVRPLVDQGLLEKSAGLTIHGLSGYSGGGKSLIERWESPDEGRVGLPYEAPYALEKVHKHSPEMQTYALLDHPPHFMPAVGPFKCGMRVDPCWVWSIPGVRTSPTRAWSGTEAGHFDSPADTRPDRPPVARGEPRS